MSEEYDVIVAGGGPAGLSVARTASREGAEVLLLELQAQIGQIQTLSWISSGILEEKFTESVIEEIKRVRLHSVHRELEIEGEFGEIVDRKVLDKLLSLEAVEAGADIWVGSPVKGLLDTPRGIRGVRSEAGDWSEEIESKAVVDATGARAGWASLFLREVLDSSWGGGTVVRTNEYLMANVLGESEVDLYFNSMLAPMGHAWIYPSEEGLAVAGIQGVRIHPDSALDEFIGREEPSRLEEGVPIGAYRGRFPVGGPLDNTVGDGVMAVGTSAGQVYPLSGHGLKYALEAGRIAGRVVVEGMREGDTSRGKLADYDRLWRDRFEKEIKVGKMLQSALETSPDQKMDALLDILREDECLQRNFVNLFLGKDVENSLESFFKEEECKRIFGKEKVDRILSLYS